MPGDNCSIVGCGTNRRTKGVGIFKLPGAKNEKYKKWRANWLNEVTKSRVMDKGFRKLIQNDRVFTCEKHFRPEDLEIFTTDKMTKKKPIFGSLPTHCMPKKSIEIGKQKVRRKARATTEANQSPPKSCYKSLDEVIRCVKKMKHAVGYSATFQDDKCVIIFQEKQFLLPTYTLSIDDSLGFTISVFGWFLPEDHSIYLLNKRSVRNVKILDLLHVIKGFSICNGTTQTDNNSIIMHAVPKTFDPLMEDYVPFPHKEIWRSVQCEILCKPEQQCNSCMVLRNDSAHQAKKRRKIVLLPAKTKAPISRTSPWRIKLTLQAQRLKCAQLQKKIDEMQKELVRPSVDVDHSLSNNYDLTNFKVINNVTVYNL